MILTLARVTEGITEGQTTFVHEFALDPKFPQNKTFKAVLFQIVTSSRLPESVGHQYIIYWKPMTTLSEVPSAQAG